MARRRDGGSTYGCRRLYIAHAIPAITPRTIRTSGISNRIAHLSVLDCTLCLGQMKAPLRCSLRLRSPSVPFFLIPSQSIVYQPSAWFPRALPRRARGIIGSEARSQGLRNRTRMENQGPKTSISPFRSSMPPVAKRGEFAPPDSTQVLDSIENASPQTGQLHPVFDALSSPFAPTHETHVFPQ